MSLKKIVFFGIIIASFFIINGLSHSMYTLWQKNELMAQAQAELEKEKKENQTLQKKLAEVKKPQFVEEEARNNLFLAKPGEGTLVIPTEYQKTSASATKKTPDIRPHWQKWWEIFM